MARCFTHQCEPSYKYADLGVWRGVRVLSILISNDLQESFIRIIQARYSKWQNKFWQGRFTAVTRNQYMDVHVYGILLSSSQRLNKRHVTYDYVTYLAPVLRAGFFFGYRLTAHPIHFPCDSRPHTHRVFYVTLAIPKGSYEKYQQYVNIYFCFQTK